jgi:sugar-specific transcriptional regulator TrmB
MQQQATAPQPVLEKILAKAGLSQRQTEVYLALLKLGKGTVAEVMRDAGMNRTTGYSVLDSLVKKGLVTISGREPSQEYVAESPDRLAAYLDREAKEAQERAKEVKSLIPELKSIHNVSGRPKVMFYEGEEGLERVYEDTLTSHEPIRAYANVEELNMLPGYFPEYFKRRAAKGIAIRGIFPDNETSLALNAYNAEELRETAVVPSSKYFFAPEINIYDDKIMIASQREKLGIIIQSKEIAEAMKSIYELAWEQAKRVDVRKKKKR